MERVSVIAIVLLIFFASSELKLSSQIRLILSNKNNPNRLIELPLDYKNVSESPYFNKTKQNIFIVHGWKGYLNQMINVILREAYHNVTDANVFNVDWSKYSKQSYLYVTAENVVKTGMMLGKFLENLQKNLNLGPEKFLLIGHSLGAHVIGNAGRYVNGNIGTIVGLDPAGPAFNLLYPEKRLRKTDAEFVHVVHASLVYGVGKPMGHADYVANGGMVQPGCIPMTMCSHRRAVEYFAESIVSGGFSAWKCESYLKFSSNECFENPKSWFGGIVIDKNASGLYFFTTSNNSPFSLA